MATEVKPKQATGPVEPKSSEEKVVETARHFWDRNSKFITYVIVGLILVVGGYFGYKNYVVAPEEQKAEDLIWKAQDFYKVDSFAKALNGDGQTAGFLRVISRHGSTKAGNLAKFYAGSCYLELGDFNNALKYLKDFETDQPALKVRAYGLLGDANSELGKNRKQSTTIQRPATPGKKMISTRRNIFSVPLC